MKRAIGSHAARRLPEPAAMLPNRKAVAARMVVRQLEMRMGRGSAVRKPDALPNRAILRISPARVSAGGLADTSFETVQLDAAYYRLRTADCRLPTADC